MISSEAQAEIARMRAERKPDRPLAQSRREWEEEALAQMLPADARVMPQIAGGVACEWMEVAGVAQDRVFLLLHGGGYNAGSPKTHRGLAAELSRATKMRVLVPDYRLAPEHPYPAALEDALLVYRWLLSQGITEENIIVGGDSAGGGLTLSMFLALREAKAKLPRGAVLLAPWTDLTASSPSYTELRERDPTITQEGLREAGLWYAGERDPADPMLSPLFADLGGLPPMLIHAGGDEVMVDDSRIFAERAEAAGVAVTAKIFPGLWHVFHHAGAAVPEARQALDEIGVFVEGVFRG